MRAHFFAVVLVAACRYNEPTVGIGAGDDGGVVDVPPDIAFDGPVECYGTGLGVQACLPQPMQPVNLMGGTMLLNTDSSPLCTPANPTTLCVLAGTDVTIDTQLVVSGSRALVIVATGALTVK